MPPKDQASNSNINKRRLTPGDGSMWNFFTGKHFEVTGLLSPENQINLFAIHDYRSDCVDELRNSIDSKIRAMREKAPANAAFLPAALMISDGGSRITHTALDNYIDMFFGYFDANQIQITELIVDKHIKSIPWKKLLTPALQHLIIRDLPDIRMSELIDYHRSEKANLSFKLSYFEPITDLPHSNDEEKVSSQINVGTTSQIKLLIQYFTSAGVTCLSQTRLDTEEELNLKRAKLLKRKQSSKRANRRSSAAPTALSETPPSIMSSSLILQSLAPHDDNAHQKRDESPTQAQVMELTLCNQRQAQRILALQAEVDELNARLALHESSTSSASPATYQAAQTSLQNFSVMKNESAMLPPFPDDDVKYLNDLTIPDFPPF
jgi:hypothetical protein